MISQFPQMDHRIRSRLAAIQGLPIVASTDLCLLSHLFHPTWQRWMKITRILQ